MRTAIVIPARLSATRLPNKPLADLGGMPLVVRVARQAEQVPGVSPVLIATDSQSIVDAAASFNVRAVLTRADHPSGTDRIAEVARSLDVDALVNVQGDEPFVDPNDLAAIVGLLAAGAEMATLRAPLEDAAELADPNVVKVVCADDGNALYFSRAPIPFYRDRPGMASGAFRHVGVYGYRKATLLRLSGMPPHPLEACERLEQLRALAAGIRIAVTDAKSRGRGIDTADDLAWARAEIARLGAAAFPRYVTPATPAPRSSP